MVTNISPQFYFVKFIFHNEANKIKGQKTIKFLLHFPFTFNKLSTISQPQKITKRRKSSAQMSINLLNISCERHGLLSVDDAKTNACLQNTADFSLMYFINKF